MCIALCGHILNTKITFSPEGMGFIFKFYVDCPCNRNHRSTITVSLIDLRTIGLSQYIFILLLQFVFFYTIDLYNTSARITAQILKLFVSVNFKRYWRNLQINNDFERQILQKLFNGRFIYSQNFCQRSAERKWMKKYLVSNFVLMPDLEF